jgi:hypothetical protein
MKVLEFKLSDRNVPFDESLRVQTFRSNFQIVMFHLMKVLEFKLSDHNVPFDESLKVQTFKSFTHSFFSSIIILNVTKMTQIEKHRNDFH